MWELDRKEHWVPKNWCFLTVVLAKTLKSPLDCKEIQSVHPKGNQSWIFIERTDVEVETPILWPSNVKNWLTGKDPDVGKDWRQKEKGMTEDEMVGWHHQLDGHEFAQVLGVGDGQGSLESCSPWGLKESDMTEWTELKTWCSQNKYIHTYMKRLSIAAMSLPQLKKKQSLIASYFNINILVFFFFFQFKSGFK